MRFVLDHCVARPLLKLLDGFEIQPAGELGWEELSNGKLLAAAEAAGFSALVTVDKGFRHQQNLSERTISVILLDTPDTRIQSLAGLVPALRRTLEALPAERLTIIGDSERDRGTPS